MLKFEFNHKEFSDEKLNFSINKILSKTTLLSLATINEDGLTPHICTTYFAYNDKLHLYIITDPATKHSQNLNKNSNVAITVFNSHQGFWEDNMEGLQLFGTCKKLSLTSSLGAFSCFSKRFPVFNTLIKKPDDILKKAFSIRFHEIKIDRLKLFDEETFGEEVFIDLNIS